MHLRSDKAIDDLARMWNPVLRGWINYYGRFYKSACTRPSAISMARWCGGPCGNTRGCEAIVGEPALARGDRRSRAEPVCPLAAPWACGRRLDDGSRMSGDVHVRFCERPGVRFPRATHLVVLVDSHVRHWWLRGRVEKRLREEYVKLDLEVNEDKSRRVDLAKGESFGFLGFLFRRIRSERGRWMPLRIPQIKKRTALLRKLKEIFRRLRSQPVEKVIAEINPILRGWVNYFAIGHSSRCFSYIRSWVEKKIRRHLAKARKRRGFGWKRWSTGWLYGELGLFNEYRVTWPGVITESGSSMIGLITLDAK